MAKKHLRKSPRYSFNGAVYRQPDKVVDEASGYTLLISAIIDKDAGKIEALLASGADPCVADKDGKSPLHHAALLGQKETVEMLLQAGAQANQRDALKMTPLFEALGSPVPLEMVNCLLKGGADGAIQDIDDNTPLHKAAAGADRSLVQRLLQATENPDRPNKDGQTPLHLACASGSREVVHALLAAGLSVAALDANSNTPLLMAAQRPDTSVAEDLLATVAAQTVNVRNQQDETPLYLAVLDKNIPLVEMLLQAGADVNVVTTLGNTPLHLAVRCGDEKLILLLIHNGADVRRRKAGEGETLLTSAIGNDQMGAFRLLLSYNADPNTPDTLSPLFTAYQRGNAEAMEILLKAGANPNHPDSQGRTALHFIVEERWNINLTLLKKLLDAGADPLVADKFSFTAYDRAVSTNSVSTEDAFRQKLAEKGINYTPKRLPPPYYGH